MSPARLLLVDEHEDHLELLTVMLGMRYRVSSFGSAAEALLALEAVEPEVLVLDVGMTPADGVHCLAAVRAIPGYAGLPAVALTACAREVDRAVFLAGGFQAVVTKPIVDDEQLFGIIDTLHASSASGRRRSIGDHGIGAPTMPARAAVS